MDRPDDAIPEVLARHLRSWVGAWPAEHPVLIVANPRMDQPVWDGSMGEVVGIADGEGRVVIGVAPALEPLANAAPFVDLDELMRDLPARLERPGQRMFSGVMRWTVTPASLPDAGVWLPIDDPRVPPWLHPFGGDVLVALEDDRYAAGVGIKNHDAWGQELAVATEGAARGRGLARRLVAQAARRVVDEGAVATYLHAPDNVGSARVADAAGFPDRGWKILGMFDASAPPG